MYRSGISDYLPLVSVYALLLVLVSPQYSVLVRQKQLGMKAIMIYMINSSERYYIHVLLGFNAYLFYKCICIYLSVYLKLF